MTKANRHKKWFVEAIYDLKLGKTTYDWPDRSLLRCGHFAHQCIEKSLKGYLIYLGHAYPKKHDLGHLAELVISADESLKDILVGVEDLNTFYLAGRYPDAVDDVVMKNVERKIESYFVLAKNILDELLKRSQAGKDTLK